MLIYSKIAKKIKNKAKKVMIKLGFVVSMKI